MHDPLGFLEHNYSHGRHRSLSGRRAAMSIPGSSVTVPWGSPWRKRPETPTGQSSISSESFGIHNAFLQKGHWEKLSFIVISRNSLQVYKLTTFFASSIYDSFKTLGKRDKQKFILSRSNKNHTHLEAGRMTTDVCALTRKSWESPKPHTHTHPGRTGTGRQSSVPWKSNAKSPGRKMIQTYSLRLMSREDRARNSVSLS